MTDIHTRRLEWVRARQLTRDKTEKLLISLDITRYDYIVSKRYSNHEGAKKARSKIADLKRRLQNRKLSAELKAIKTAYENSKKQIEYDKKLGYTFSEEVRGNDKKYLYKQKRIGTSKEHEYVAKDWQELDTKQNHQAQEQVWRDRYSLKGLSPSEIETYDLLTDKLYEYEWDKNRIRRLKKAGKWQKFEYDSDPILRKATEKLNLRTGFITRGGRRMKLRITPDGKRIERILLIDNLPIKEIKKILQTTRKALIRRGNVDKKLEEIAICMGEGKDTPQNIENFIVYLMKEIGFYQETDEHAVRALENYINRIILKNPKSMYSVLEPIEVKIFSENVVRRFRSMGGHFEKHAV